MRACVSIVMVLASCTATAPTDPSSSSTGAATTSSVTTSGVADGSTSGPTTTGDPTTMSTNVGSSDSTGASTGAAETTTTTGEALPCSGELPTAWPDGTDCGVPELTVHRYDGDTFILRQSLCTNFEGPFLYMLFGSERVLLLDTGAGGIDVAQTVGGVIEDWLAERGQASIELVVVNTHAHGDHTAGNAMFDGLPGVTVVTPSVAGLSEFFGIDDWPEQIVTYDLGDRPLDVVPIPGHHPSHIALFDHGTSWLLTGDTLYPGRLYIDDFADYVDSVGRLADHVAALEVCNVMGTHIEMTTMAGVDYDFGADEHPNEHALPLDVAHLLELRDAVEAMAFPEIEVHDDFIIYPL